MLNRIGKWCETVRARARMRHGNCPQCNSDAPELGNCSVCRGIREWPPRSIVHEQRWVDWWFRNRPGERCPDGWSKPPEFYPWVRREKCVNCGEDDEELGFCEDGPICESCALVRSMKQSD